MNQLSAYLLVQTIALRLNTPTTLRNTVMWNKPLKVYQGVDNAYELVVTDFDQQSVTLSSYTARFRAIDANGSYALDKPLAIKVGTTNKLNLILNSEDLNDLIPGFYTYSVTLDDGTYQRPLYFEQNGNAVGQLEVLTGPFESVHGRTQAVTSFSTVGSALVSGAITLNPLDDSGSVGLHTVAIFKDSTVEGTFTIEGSLASTATSWFIIDTVELIEDTTTDYLNFNGIFNFIRYQFVPTIASTGNITLVQHRT